MLPEPTDLQQPDNFWEPIPRDLGSHGPFDRLSRNYSWQLWASENRSTLLGGLLLVGMGLSALMVSGRRNRRLSGLFGSEGIAVVADTWTS